MWPLWTPYQQVFVRGKLSELNEVINPLTLGQTWVKKNTTALTTIKPPTQQQLKENHTTTTHQLELLFLLERAGLLLTVHCVDTPHFQPLTYHQALFSLLLPQ